MRSCLAAAGWISLTILGLSAFAHLASAQDLTILSRHTGSFLLGQTNANYLLWVRNVGSAPTSGLVSVTENPPSGVTLTSMSGQGWLCTRNSCNRTDSLAAGDSYSAIIVLATVAGSAPSSVSNQATVSGGGDLNAVNNTTMDLTAIAAHGRPVSWGSDRDGRTTVPDNSPPNLVAVAAGLDHTIALKSDGTVVGWGRNDFNINQARPPAGLSDVVAIAAGEKFSLAVKSDGSLVFWGFAGFGGFTPPNGLQGVVAIATNGSRSMALSNDGTVTVWSGGDPALAAIPPSLSGVVAIAMGVYNCLALKSDGTVVSWGQTGFGQESVPTGLSNVVAIATGGFHSMALKSDGTVVAWGYNTAGETTVPQGLSNVAAIAAGHAHSLALKSDGTVVAWGEEGLAAGSALASLSNGIAIAAGEENSFVLVDAVPTTVQATLGLSAPNARFTLDGTTYAYPPMVFQWMPGSSHTIGTEPLSQGNDGEQYVFNKWSDGGAITHIVAPMYSAFYSASFDHQYRITTVANPPDGGTISPATGFFEAGSTIQITAAPSPGYPFVGFSGGLTGTANPQSLAITAAKTVTANFTAITPPAAPRLISPGNGATEVSLTTTLDWVASADAETYDVYFGTSSSPKLLGNTTATSYRPFVVVSDVTKYYWNVVAKNGGGNASSPVWSFTTQSTPPPPWTQPPPGVIPPGTPCVATVTPPISTLAGAGGSVTLSVQADSSCMWILPVLPDWITTAASLAYMGTQTFTLAVAANTGTARSAQLTFGGINATIEQAAPCACTVGTLGQGYPSAGGTGTIEVIAAPDCLWTLSEQPSWVDYIGSSSGTGSGKVGYKVAANTGPRRSATVIVGAAAFAIDQSGAVATSAGILAHFVAGGGWLTQFTLLNAGYGTAHALLNFFDDNGTAIVPSAHEGSTNPGAWPALALGDATNPTLGRTLNPGAVLHVDAPVKSGSASIESAGWGQLITDGMVDGYGVFQLKTEAGIQEAVVLPETRNAATYYLPFDNTGGYFYGVALSNATNIESNIGVVIRDAATGNVTRTDVINLAPLGHTAFVMTQKYPDIEDTRGTLEFSAMFGGEVTVLGLRFNPNHAFTSVPALVLSAVPSGQRLVTVGSMAHIAAGGGWKTLFTLSNPGASAAKARLSFAGDDGKPLMVMLSLPQMPTFAPIQTATLEQTLLPGTMLEVLADGPAVLSEQGWAQLQTDGSVTGFAAFQYQPLKGGQQEAVVPLETRGAASYILPFDSTNGYYNGVALANISGQTVAVAVTIRDAGTGAVREVESISLPAHGHIAFLLNDRYTTVAANSAVTVEFTTPAAGQVSVLGLRFNSNAAFTSVPAMVRR